MIKTEFAEYIRYSTRTNSTTFTDANIMLVANRFQDDLVMKILKVNRDYFGIFEYRNLEAGKRNYTFESEILAQMKRLEIKIEPDVLDEENNITEEKKYVTGVEYDLNFMKAMTTNESGIISYMTGKKVGYDIFGGDLIILSDKPIVDVTDGLKLATFIYPQKITDLTGSEDLSLPKNAINFGLPRAFHGLLADMVIVHNKTTREKPLPLTDQEKILPQRIQEALDNISEDNLDKVIEGGVASDDGYGY